jgi:peptidoglycan hydrolase-like protein with peptidoglycan-binding domain
MKSFSRLFLTATVALVLAPAVATAQSPPAAPTPPEQPTTPPRAPPARSPKTKRRLVKPERVEATGRIGVWLDGQVYRIGSRTLTMPGKEVRIGGRIVPYVPGQKVTVRVWNGNRLAKAVTVTPKPSKTKQTAKFAARFTAAKPGAIRVFATHARTPQQRRLASKAAAVDVINPTAGFGSTGPFVGLIQQKLAKLGYAVSQDGNYGPGTGRAIEAFRKVNGMARVQTLDGAVVDKLLKGQGGFKIRYPQQGRHVEANLSQQVLALIDNGKVYRAYTTSSGASVTPTVLGTYHFYMKDYGTNAKGMVHSNYFIRGYAIHGYPDVPTYPASHGCLRVPIPDAQAIYDWVRIGDTIDVYY